MSIALTQFLFDRRIILMRLIRTAWRLFVLLVIMACAIASGMILCGLPLFG